MSSCLIGKAKLIMLNLGQFVVEALSFVMADIPMTLLVQTDGWVLLVDLSIRTNNYDVG